MSDEEEDHVKDVINYPIHAYTNLLPPSDFFSVGLVLIPITHPSSLHLSFFFP